jgi:hypothetical protein
MEVFDGPEMRRIEAIPRRPRAWSETQSSEAQDLLTRHFRTATGTRRLKPLQARALVELHDTGALVGLLAPGAGKTDITALIPRVTGCFRMLLLVPAALVEKTLDDYAMLRKHWSFPVALKAKDPTHVPAGQPVIRILSYESLSRVGYATFIEEFDPDLIAADEAHGLQSLKSGRSKRVFRFIKNKRKKHGFDSVKFIPLTGTPWSTSIRQVAHLFEAALGKRSPLPCEYQTLEQWSLAIDRKIKPELRLQPGAIHRLSPSLPPTLDNVRGAVRDRILDTAGIVASREVDCGIPLILQHRPIVVPPEVRTAMATLLNTGILPSGEVSPGGIVEWGQRNQIGHGFAYYYDPPPPAAWRNAKSAWYSFVKTIVDQGKLDTPFQVWLAVEAGKFGNVPEFHNWNAIKDTFKTNSKPKWISDFLVRDAEKWALETGGIVWVPHSTAHTDEPDDDAIGGMFKAIPYFGGGDERIKSYRGPCAASIRSHGTGKNLTQWDTALLMGFPSGGKTLEQLLARHHREGQTSEVVTFHFYAHALENLNAIEACLEDAKFVSQTSDMDQRILGANLLDASGKAFTIERYREEQDPSDPMWAKRS